MKKIITFIFFLLISAFSAYAACQSWTEDFSDDIIDGNVTLVNDTTSGITFSDGYLIASGTSNANVAYVRTETIDNTEIANYTCRFNSTLTDAENYSANRMYLWPTGSALGSTISNPNPNLLLNGRKNTSTVAALSKYNGATTYWNTASWQSGVYTFTHTYTEYSLILSLDGSGNVKEMLLDGDGTLLAETDTAIALGGDTYYVVCGDVATNGFFSNSAMGMIDSFSKTCGAAPAEPPFINTPPVLSSGAFNQTDYYNDSAIQYSVYVEDADANTTELNYTWYLNGNQEFSGLYPAVSPNSTQVFDYTYTQFVDGDNVSIAITAYDGENYSNTVEDSKIIQTYPPVLECSDSIDNDGDSFTDFGSDVGCVSADDINETETVLIDSIVFDKESYCFGDNVTITATISSTNLSDVGVTIAWKNGDFIFYPPIGDISSGIVLASGTPFEYTITYENYSTSENYISAGSVLRIDVQGYNYDSYSVINSTDITMTNCSIPPATQCSDSADNDGDGLTDLADPDCANPADDTEYGSVPAPVPVTVTECGIPLWDAMENIIEIVVVVATMFFVMSMFYRRTKER